jgi:uncharacterized protein involved in response to NO
MVVGYVGAVVAGFLLTAVPNWTGTAPLAGGPLAALAALWLAGRAAPWLGAVPDWLAAGLDVAFLPALGLAVARPLIAARKPRNAVFLGFLGLLTAASALVHAEGLGLAPDTGAPGVRLGLDTAILMIAIIGGRIVPTFTANALATRGEPAELARRPTIELLAILATILFLAGDVLVPGTVVAGAAALAAAALHGLRLSGWRTRRTLGSPILWVLHLGYAWLAAGLAIKGIADLTTLVPETVALHGLTVGAIGTMTIAVMSRATLGHTGRPLVAPRVVVLAYLLVSASAIARLAAGFLGPSANIAAAALWVAAFGLFLGALAPALLGQRAPAG